PGIEPRNTPTSGRRRHGRTWKAKSGASISRDATESRAVTGPAHAQNHHAREPGDPRSALGRWNRGTRREAQGRKPAMNGPGKSDSPVIPVKSPNKAGQPVAEGMEGRELAK